MPQLRIVLDAETYQRLLEAALSERRPVPFQAEVVLRRAFGLPFPYQLRSARPGARAASGENTAPLAPDSAEVQA